MRRPKASPHRISPSRPHGSPILSSTRLWNGIAANVTRSYTMLAGGLHTALIAALRSSIIPERKTTRRKTVSGPMPIKAGWLITKKIIIIQYKSSTGQAPVRSGEYDYDYNYGQESHLRNIVILPHSTLMSPVRLPGIMLTMMPYTKAALPKWGLRRAETEILTGPYARCPGGLGHDQSSLHATGARPGSASGL